MTFEKAFDSIKKKFADADVKDISDFALQVTLSDEDCGGTFYIAVQSGVLAVEPYDYKDNNAVLDIAKSDLLAIIGGRKSIDKAVESGASLKGDAAVIDSLKAMFKTPAKKAPAKKAAAKKTAAKKAAPKKAAVKKPAAKAEKKAEVKPAVKAEKKAEEKPAVKPAAAKTEKTTAKKTAK